METDAEPAHSDMDHIRQLQALNEEMMAVNLLMSQADSSAGMGELQLAAQMDKLDFAMTAFEKSLAGSDEAVCFCKSHCCVSHS